MKIKIKTSSFYYFLYGITLIYILTFGLWDSISQVPKYVFNVVMIFSISMFLITEFCKRRTVMNRNTLLLYMLSMAYYVLNAVSLTDKRLISNGLYSYLYYQLLVVAWLYALKKINVRKLFSLFEAFGVVSSVLGVHEVQTGKLLLGGTAYGKSFSNYYIVRAVVFSGSFLTLGMFLAICVIISFFQYESTKKMIHIFSMIMCLIGLIVTSSRGPLVATIVCLILIYLLFDTPNFKTRARKVITLFLTIAVLLIVFLLLANTVMKNNYYVSYLRNRFQSIFDWTNESGNVGRVNRWALFRKMFSKNWLFGIGIGGSGTRAAQLTGALNTESGVLKRLLELGIFGSVIYYLFIFDILKSGFRYYLICTKTRKNSAILAGLAIIIAILIEETIMQITETIMVSSVFWMFIAYIILASQAKIDKTLDI